MDFFKIYHKLRVDKYEEIIIFSIPHSHLLSQPLLVVLFNSSNRTFPVIRENHNEWNKLPLQKNITNKYLTYNHLVTRDPTHFLPTNLMIVVTHDGKTVLITNI